MPRRPKIFFDTSLCSHIAQKVIEPADWSRVGRRVFREFRYYISPLTVYELVSALATADPKFFTQNREAIRVVYPVGQKRFLEHLRVFVPNTLWGEHRKAPDHVEADYDLWLKAILTAPDRRTLESGKLKVSMKGRKGFGLLLDEINRSMRTVQRDYAKKFSALRLQPVPQLTREVWARLMLRDLKKEILDRDRGQILDRFDAAYCFDRHLWSFIQNPSYDFSKHATELVDAQQLYYLCDSEMHFATTDNRLKNVVRNSLQSNRILTYDELRAI